MMKNKKSALEPAITTTRRRVFIVSVAFILFTVYLLFNLIKLQIFSYDEYKDKVYEQITTSSALKAKRGNIYDSNMNTIATSENVWRIFISSRDINRAEKESGINYSEIIAKGLSDIFSLNSDDLLVRIRKTSVLDVTVEKAASKEEYERVLAFIKENALDELVFTEAQNNRYYPESTFASHTIGFCGSDNQGLYGLEYYYNSILSGKDGYYLYAKDANGNALDTEYSSYIPAEDGNSIVTTLDYYLQTELESQLQQIVNNHGVENRATGIVMNTETGAILAMATSSPFDPNSPYSLDELSQKELDAAGYEKDSAEYKALKKELLEIMWSNKAVSETYEPGSTFKIVTVATALSVGAAKMSDTFSCHGYHEVGGWKIRCHKTTGHGSGFTLAYGLQMSCNPTMMQIAERTGAEAFYDYVEKFGYFEKSGIDLPSEASTIFHKEENIGKTELATISFGQRFKVSIINHLRAIAAVANGGYLVTPYLVEKIIDSNGNVVSEHEPEIIRQVISADVAATLASVLEEGVSGEGGAKNARVDGYKVAAKTGTSQKFDILDENGNSYLRIGSTVAFAPSDKSGIAVIIVVDEPTSAVKYGSFVAAPYISAFLEKGLPYLSYESELETKNTEVRNYVGLGIDTAKKKLDDEKIRYQIIGSGNTVIAQTPESGNFTSSELTTIILYTEIPNDFVTVPSLVGLEASEAAKLLINSGLNVCLGGSYDSGHVVWQSLPTGARVKRGTSVKITVLISDFEG